MRARSGFELGSISTVLISALLVACGSGSDDADHSNGQGGSGAGGSGAGGSAVGGSGPLGNFLACPNGERFHLVGEVDGQSIEVTEAPTLGGFAQTSAAPGSHFRLPNEGDDEPETLIVVSFTWEGVSASKEITPIEGWVRLPLGVPLEGQTICAGPGSTMVMPGNEDELTQGEFQFEMVALASGTNCDQPISGDLSGCWSN